MKIINVLLILILLISLPACGSFEKIITVTTKPADIPDKVVQEPDVVTLRKIEWHILTDQNISEIISKIQDEGNTPVLFALTARDYENLSLNMKDIIILMMQQKEIINTFKTKKKEETDVNKE